MKTVFDDYAKEYSDYFIDRFQEFEKKLHLLKRELIA